MTVCGVQEYEDELVKLKQQKTEYEQKMEEIGQLQIEKKVRTRVSAS